MSNNTGPQNKEVVCVIDYTMILPCIFIEAEYDLGVGTARQDFKIMLTSNFEVCS